MDISCYHWPTVDRPVRHHSGTRDMEVGRMGVELVAVDPFTNPTCTDESIAYLIVDLVWSFDHGPAWPYVA